MDTNKKIIRSRYGVVQVKNDQPIKYLTTEQVLNGEQGYVLAPYTIAPITHVEICDARGTRRIRQVSRWRLFKLWIKSVYMKFSNFKI